jgi:thymidylate synthase (FAD)
MDLKSKYLPVLDGFVGLVDFMGTDADIERAARTSYGKDELEPKETGRLINYLTKHQHGTPSEMVIAKFHIACPIFVMRQLIRHRVLSVNEFSGRYTECPDKFYLPEAFRAQSKTNKQGSEGTLEINKDEVADHYKASYELYKKLLGQGVSKELARIVLPLSLYTYFYVECDLRNWFHFISLRSDSHAQHEIQVYSDAIGKFLKQLFPKSFEAFLNYKFNSRSFTWKEIQFLQDMAYLLPTNSTTNLPEIIKTKSELAKVNERSKIWSTDREIDDFIKNITFVPNDGRFDLNNDNLKEASYFKEQNNV